LYRIVGLVKNFSVYPTLDNYHLIKKLPEYLYMRGFK